MKFVSLLGLFFLLLVNPVFADTKLLKSEILKKSNKCLNNPQKQICKKLILQMEQFQALELDQNRLKCQTSILGLQTELIGAYFFEQKITKMNGIMIPYVIKNC